MSLTSRSPAPPPAPSTPPTAAPDGAGPSAPATTTRREFAAALALTALGACAPRAVTTAPARGAAATPPEAAPAGPGRVPDPVSTALVAVVTARYGADVVPAGQRASFEDAVARTLELSRRLRQTPVANGVDPFASLCPTPSGGRRAP